jgi:hypothetical protein
MPRLRFGATLALALLLAVPAHPQAPAEPPEPPPEPEIVGAPAAFGADASAEERVAVPEGTALRELPDLRSPALATIDAPSELPVVERRGPWLRVRYGALLGWLTLDGSLPPVLPYAGGGQARARALAAAEAWAGPPPPSGRPSLGGWTLYTDVADRPLLAYLDRVAAGLAQVYRERYGLDPGAPEGDAVVLFAREADYRALAEENAGLLGIGEGGHAGRGVAALYAGERERAELASLLVHELTHLMNARALGPRTPPWLEEGLANDLGFSEIGRRGRLEPATVGGEERRSATVDPATDAMVVHLAWEGAKGALVGLERRLREGGLPPVYGLTQLTWHELVDPAERSTLYAESAFFVRFLLDRDPSALRGYLRYLASGGGDDPAALSEALGGDWPDLDAEFRRWLLARAQAVGLTTVR